MGTSKPDHLLTLAAGACISVNAPRQACRTVIETTRAVKRTSSKTNSSTEFSSLILACRAAREYTADIAADEAATSSFCSINLYSINSNPVKRGQLSGRRRGSKKTIPALAPLMAASAARSTGIAPPTKASAYCRSITGFGGSGSETRVTQGPVCKIQGLGGSQPCAPAH